MKQKRFDRPIGTRKYKRLFIIASEGELTEPSYFELISSSQTIVQVKNLKPGQSSPKYVLKRLVQHIKEAIRRAKSCDRNPDQPIPSLPGSRVYKLVQQIIDAEQ